MRAWGPWDCRDECLEIAFERDEALPVKRGLSGLCFGGERRWHGCCQ